MQIAVFLTSDGSCLILITSSKTRLSAWESMANTVNGKESGAYLRWCRSAAAFSLL